jgi:RNA polymerase sigma factor (sigma-70 family)
MDASVLPGHPAYVRRSRAALRMASDKRLVALVRAGEAVAFEVLYDRHARKLLSFCRHMLGSRQDGEDALQRTFASAYRALLVDDREIELRPWLYAIARNECLSILRQRHPTGELDGAEPATEGLSSRVEGREDLRDLLADLHTLPERQRAALLLSELGGFTHAQIAQAVGARPDQIKAYVFQARSNLIAERDARERSCVEVRAQLASTRGAGLLQRELSRHLRRCRGCREYSAALRRQRQALAIVLPVAPSLALRSAVLRAALGSAHGPSASTGIAGAGLALTNSGGKALLTKGLAVIALAGVSAGAGTLALHAVSRHHPRAQAPAPAKAGSPHSVLVGAQHPVAPVRSRRYSSLPAPLPRAALRAARSGPPPPGTFGPVAASGTKASTPTRMGPARRIAPAAGSQDSGPGAHSQPGLLPTGSAGARSQPGLVGASAGAPQAEPGNGSHARGAERSAANAGAAKEHAGVRSGSISPSAGRGEHGIDASSQPPGAGSTAAGESIDSTPGHAYGQETGRSTPPGQESGAVSSVGDARGNSASAPGQHR